mmetsp:Transcript_5481/g.9290  ORF Transcript_5481/g.9290 Transcript_5481/m.9290 type:complete len:268 (-) Transcript_5481:147-950(-)|eukprot:CAMPEP_0168620566 /NCGR_PEP_ID=MMETSP0449_2-20121227/7210_1 /TAXON_ID=1082188 /ORGANISM="Strombidium rassoulzadegani, Strain ras09" /LENGTH=267 /DNA_ID=CAMNT_0008661589 /DNA_START=567 /DNA_END=1370 /DNA_ORIENTATION=-
MSSQKSLASSKNNSFLGQKMGVEGRKVSHFKNNRMSQVEMMDRAQKLNSLSISEIDLRQSIEEPPELGVPGYHVNSEMRFNFKNKQFKIPQSRLKRFVDLHIEEKKLVPSPDKYSHQRKHFNDMRKNSKIYTRDRQSFFADVMKESKASPGVGKYEITAFDEKRNKRPNASYKQSQPRIYPSDEAMYISSQIPGSYPAVKLDTIKKRPYQYVGYRKETDQQKQSRLAREKEEAKNPSPLSYQVAQAIERTSGKGSVDRSNRYYSIPK